MRRRDLRFVSVAAERSVSSQLEDAIVHYRALIIVPHDVSELSLTALYRMNIPMFVPSTDLLMAWCATGRALGARQIGHPARQLDLLSVRSDAPDPNEATRESLEYWLPFVDLNTLPHLLRFDSFGDLVEQLSQDGVDELLERTSEAMRAFNIEQRAALSAQWGGVLTKVREARPRK